MPLFLPIELKVVQLMTSARTLVTSVMSVRAVFLFVIKKTHMLN
ncbi:hypothetical protein QY97_02932 [Bacillus thermotolerans]|nr:hypothetical protein QY97_02932 [Bacillus thermotolerans]